MINMKKFIAIIIIVPALIFAAGLRKGDRYPIFSTVISPKTQRLRGMQNLAGFCQAEAGICNGKLGACPHFSLRPMSAKIDRQVPEFAQSVYEQIRGYIKVFSSESATIEEKLEAGRQIVEKKQRRSRQILLNILLHNPDPDSKLAATEALIKFVKMEVELDLKDIFMDSDTGKRILESEKISYPASLKTKEAIAIAFVRVQKDEIKGFLAAMFASNENIDTKKAAAIGLSKLGKEGNESLKGALRNNRNNVVKQIAAFALAITANGRKILEKERKSRNPAVKRCARQALAMYRESGGAGLIFRGDPEKIITALKSQAGTFTRLRNSIDRGAVVESWRDILDDRKDALKAKRAFIPAIEKAIEDFKSEEAGLFNLIEFDVVLFPENSRDWAAEWLIDFNTFMPTGAETSHSRPRSEAKKQQEINAWKLKMELRSLFDDATIGYAREALDKLRGDALLEYLLHPCLCVYLGHEKARIVQEILFAETNYKDAKTQKPIFTGRWAGDLDGKLTKAMRQIRKRNFHPLPEAQIAHAKKKSPTDIAFASLPETESIETDLIERDATAMQITETLTRIREAVLEPDPAFGAKENEVLTRGAIFRLIELVKTEARAETVNDIAELIYELIYSSKTSQTFRAGSSEETKDALIDALLRLFNRFFKSSRCWQFNNEVLSYFEKIIRDRRLQRVVGMDGRIQGISWQAKEKIVFAMCFEIQRSRDQEATKTKRRSKQLQKTLQDTLIYLAEHQEELDYALSFVLDVLAEEGNKLAIIIREDIYGISQEDEMRSATTQINEETTIVTIAGCA